MIAVAALAVAAVAVLALPAALRWQARDHRRAEHAWTTERVQLIETVCHLADRPLPEKWRVPDVAVAEPEDPGRFDYSPTPEPGAY